MIWNILCIASMVFSIAVLSIGGFLVWLFWDFDTRDPFDTTRYPEEQEP